MLALILLLLAGQDAGSLRIPSEPLAFGIFTATFDPAGTFRISGAGWGTVAGHWKLSGNEIEFSTPDGPEGCKDQARYTVSPDGTHVTFAVVTDTCQGRRMILDRSTWRPATEQVEVPVRQITASFTAKPPAKPLGPEIGRAHV